MIGVAVALGLQLFLLYTPVAVLFDVVPLALVHWGQIGLALATFGALLAALEHMLDRYYDRY
ncbi:P-type HAD superfamily ATPase [Halobiforma lacisalsi AJ5]|uniref:P-type HAD superfamily ATPase n=1 Tax=Natronobacterium lacisalsi AJ5 TaxID=358396 RepID=M0LI20_NATLA|nr:P-type HAD superfamily ATPase [Halobiforma lacisalsi AJ5]